MLSRVSVSRLPSSSHFVFSTRRSLSISHARLSTSSQSNSFREGFARYKVFGSPFAKVFLGAIFTYQVIHWTWLKLEMDESKLEKNQQVVALETEVKELTGAQK